VATAITRLLLLLLLLRQKSSLEFYSKTTATTSCQQTLQMPPATLATVPLNYLVKQLVVSATFIQAETLTEPLIVVRQPVTRLWQALQIQ